MYEAPEFPEDYLSVWFAKKIAIHLRRFARRAMFINDSPSCNESPTCVNSARTLSSPLKCTSRELGTRAQWLINLPYQTHFSVPLQYPPVTPKRNYFPNLPSSLSFIFLKPIHLIIPCVLFSFQEKVIFLDMVMLLFSYFAAWKENEAFEKKCLAKLVLFSGRYF